MRLLGTLVAARPEGSLALMAAHAGDGPRVYRVGETVQGRRLAEIRRGGVILTAGDRQESLLLAEGVSQEEAAWGAWSLQELSQVSERWLSREPLLHPQGVERVTRAIHVVSETERLVDAGQVWSELRGDPFRVVGEAAWRPVVADGTVKGIRLASVAPEGILWSSGFRRGDVIRTVNGRPALDPRRLFTLAGELQAASVIEVGLERAGRPVTLRYRMQ